MANEKYHKKFSFGLVGANEDGTHIYCRLRYKKTKRKQINLIKGRYNFNKECFTIQEEFHMRSAEIGYNSHQVRKILREFLKEFDWI